MKQINFIVGSVGWVQYFIPLVKEGNRRGIRSIFFLRQNRKRYANPFGPKHYALIQRLANKYNILLKRIREVINFPGLTFLMEGDITGTTPEDYGMSGLNYLKNLHLKVSLLFNADLFWSYEKYINGVDYVIFPNEVYAKTYKKLSNKNLYIGSPKFDLEFNKENIYQKYRLSPNNKYVLFFYPKRKWWRLSKTLNANVSKFFEIFTYLKRLGYTIIVKTREKDSLNYKLGDYYFEDLDLYPNSSVELLQISDLAVFFSSTSIEECVMFKVPFIDFKVDPDLDRFRFLHNPKYSTIIKNFRINFEVMRKIVNNITKEEHKECFQETIDKYLFDRQNISAKILDKFIEQSDELSDKARKLYDKLREIKVVCDRYQEIMDKKISEINPILERIYRKKKEREEAARNNNNDGNNNDNNSEDTNNNENN